VCVDNLICSDLDSKDGIRVIAEKANSNPVMLNVERPAPIRQYFGCALPPKKNESLKEGHSERYSYAVASGTNSVGTDPSKFVTREMTSHMLLIADHLQKLMSNNIDLLNLGTVDLSHKLNHCTLLIYHADGTTKSYSAMGLHSDCNYSHDGTFTQNSNTQVKNTPAVIVSLGTSRVLNWERRYLKRGPNGRNRWVVDDLWGEQYLIEQNTVTIVNPNDEDPLNPKNIIGKYQYQHGGVKVTNKDGSQMSVALVFRRVNATRMYHNDTDTIMCDGNEQSLDSDPEFAKFDPVEFHQNLLSLYRMIFF